jgi:hypothetical protein
MEIQRVLLELAVVVVQIMQALALLGEQELLLAGVAVEQETITLTAALAALVQMLEEQEVDNQAQ